MPAMHFGVAQDFLIAKGDQIDWAALGCDTSNGKWRKPTKSDPEYEFRSELGFYPSSYTLGRILKSEEEHLLLIHL